MKQDKRNVHDIKRFLSCSVPFKEKMEGCERCRLTPEEQREIEAGIDKFRMRFLCKAKWDYFEEVRRR